MEMNSKQFFPATNAALTVHSLKDAKALPGQMFVNVFSDDYCVAVIYCGILCTACSVAKVFVNCIRILVYLSAIIKASHYVGIVSVFHTFKNGEQLLQYNSVVIFCFLLIQQSRWPCNVTCFS